MILAKGRHFTVPIYRTLSRPDKSPNHTHIRTSYDDVMEHIIVGFVASQNSEFAAKLVFHKWFELMVDEVPMLRDFSTDLLIEHHLTVNDLIQRLIVLSRQKDRCNAVFASAARGNISRARHRSNSILKLTYLPSVSSNRITAS